MRDRLSSCAVSLALVAAVVSLSPPSTARAVSGCCVCFNCDMEPAFCTEQMSSPPDCVSLCAGFGCPASAFSTVDTCATGCAGFAPFPTSTPTLTPTPTDTPVPTDTPTATPTLTPADTPTPVFCCQASSPNRCGIAEPSNEPTCAAGESPITNAACVSGSCLTFTPTRTPTNTPTPPAPTPTQTSTGTPTLTPTITPTPELIFNIDPYACYRAKSSEASASKGETVTVTDAFGTKMTKIVKPFLECAPANVEGSGTPMNPNDFLTCYKVRDLTKGNFPDVMARNLLDDAGLDLDLVRVQLICVPSLVSGIPPPASPTATPSATPTDTP